MDNKNNNLVRDLGVIVLSVLIAVILGKTGVLESIISSTQGAGLIGSFIAGIFFTSVFTTAPATVALGEIAKFHSLVIVAVVGGFGALVGDLIIFRFIKDKLSEDLLHLLKTSKSERLLAIFRRRAFRWFVPMLGALIIASPLPDEIGVAMMGLSRMKSPLFIPLSFILNFTGIMIIGLIARAI